MAGQKGRSGRKSLKVEVDTNELFNLSHQTLLRALNSVDIAESKKIDIALAIYCKHLPSKMEHSGEVKSNPTVIVVNLDERVKLLNDDALLKS